jgi:hypothetical protein
VLGAIQHDRALTLDDLDDGAPDLVTGRSSGAGAQAMKLIPDGRHDISAGCRVDVSNGGVTLFHRGRLTLVLRRPVRCPTRQRAAAGVVIIGIVTAIVG